MSRQEEPPRTTLSWLLSTNARFLSGTRSTSWLGGTTKHCRGNRWERVCRLWYRASQWRPVAMSRWRPLSKRWSPNSLSLSTAVRSWTRTTPAVPTARRRGGVPIQLHGRLDWPDDAVDDDSDGETFEHSRRLAPVGQSDGPSPIDPIRPHHPRANQDGGRDSEVRAMAIGAKSRPVSDDARNATTDSASAARRAGYRVSAPSIGTNRSIRRRDSDRGHPSGIIRQGDVGAGLPCRTFVPYGLPRTRPSVNGSVPAWPTQRIRPPGSPADTGNR